MSIYISKRQSSVLVQFDTRDDARQFASFTNDFTVWDAYCSYEQVEVVADEVMGLDSISEYAKRYRNLLHKS